MKKIILPVLLILVLTSCASIGHKLDQSAVDKIKKGETTKDQVLKLVGSPDQVITLGNGNTLWSYYFVRATSKAVNFVPVVGAFAGGANAQNQTLILTIGSNGVVEDIVGMHGATEVNTGLLSTGSKANMPDVKENKRPK